MFFMAESRVFIVDPLGSWRSLASCTVAQEQGETEASSIMRHLRRFVLEATWPMAKVRMAVLRESKVPNRTKGNCQTDA